MDLVREVAIAGTSFHEGAMEIIGRLKPGTALVLKREPKNRADRNALAVLFGDQLLGYIPRKVTKEFSPWIDSGGVVTVERSRTSTAWGVLTLMWNDGADDDNGSADTN